MDFITQLLVTASGHDAICVFVDRLTKMVRMAPTTSDVDAVGAARLFIDHVFRHHGMCTTLVADRGTQFTSRFFRTLMTELDCQQALSTAHHPQTNDQTERMNRILEDTLRHYVGPQQYQCDLHLPLVEFAINNSKQGSTRYTPFYLNYGRHPVTPTTLGLSTDSTHREAHDSIRRVQQEDHPVGNSVRLHGGVVTLVGIGADAAPAGQRPGPILSPWEDCSVGDSSLIGDGSLL